MNDRRFYVRREKCWGGTFVWVVYDSDRKRKWRTFKTEKAAERLRDRSNADHQRFFWATGKVA